LFFHVHSRFPVEPPDTQEYSQYEKTQHETGFSIKFGINPATGIEEHERGYNYNKPPYTYL